MLSKKSLYFFINSAFFLSQTLTIFSFSAIGEPKDIGYVSLFLSVVGIFAVIARYGSPVALIEEALGSIDKHFQRLASFNLINSILLTLICIFYFLTFEETFFFKYSWLIVLVSSMYIVLNPISFLIDQLFVYTKDFKSLIDISFYKFLLFPTTAITTFYLTESIFLSLILSNLIILLPSLLVLLIKGRFKFSKTLELKTIYINAFPYFINSLCLILIISIDKIIVHSNFGPETLGSYDIMWKLAILVELLVIMPTANLISKDVINEFSIKGTSIMWRIILIPSGFILLVALANLSFIESLWSYFFDQYIFNERVFSLMLIFFISMFSLNQLRNILVSHKLRFSALLSSIILITPVLTIPFFTKVTSLELIPSLLVFGSIASTLYSMTRILMRINAET